MITQKFVTAGVFKDLVRAKGIDELVAKKCSNGRFSLFGIARTNEIAFIVKKTRKNEAREWSGLDYLCDFIALSGIDSFRVIGLNDKP